MKTLVLSLVMCLLMGLLIACQPNQATTGGSLPTSTVEVESLPVNTPQPASTNTLEAVEPTPESIPEDEEGSSTSVPEDLSDLVITMERTPCFGFCPAYTVTINGDGTVQYVGRSNVEVEGEQTGQIAEEDLRALVQMFYDVDFWNMQDRYEDNVTDLPSTTTTIILNGETKSVYDYYGAPEELHELEQMIDQVSGAEAWIGDPTQ
jgi:hypothetical protein